MAGVGLTCDPPAQDTAEEESEPDPELEEEIHRVRFLRLRALPEEAFEEGDPKRSTKSCEKSQKGHWRRKKASTKSRGGQKP